MTSSPAPPLGQKLLGAPRQNALLRTRHLLLFTTPGRLVLAGAVIKLLMALARLAAPQSRLLGIIDTTGSLLMLAGAVMMLLAVFVQAKRRLLWRVRRKLILSYIFIGVVPALLIVSFFAVSGFILFLNVASYLVKAGFGKVTSEAVYLARMTALEIQRGPGPREAGPILEQREAALSSRYPGASIALVATGARPCTGGTSNAVPELAAAGAAPVTDREAKRADGPVVSLAVGPWAHMAAPTQLPAWINCSGFAGGIIVPRQRDRVDPNLATGDPVQLVLRGVGFPDMEKPTFAVLVDIPKNASLGELVRDETSIKVGAMSASDTAVPDAPPGQAIAAAPEAAPVSASPVKRRFPWVAFLDCTNWGDGTSTNGLVNIEVSVADVFDRLASAQARVGDLNFKDMLLWLLLVLAILFLLIEAAALVMGLTLARSITGSVHELFAGTERVRTGDFSHRIRIQARDQLGELADSFNQMTASIEDLLRQAEEKKRLEEELRIAREIQMSLLPRGQLAVPGLSVTALCVPAREVGGDYYDFIPLDGDRLGIVVADVSGKGTSAALYMAELKGVILSLAKTCHSPRELLITANRIIAENLDSRSFITMTYCVLDLVSRRLTYARAGHTPLIYRPETPAGDGEVRILTPDGLVLGLRLDDGSLFERLLVEETLDLHRGDVLLLFTDGISEAMNGESDLFGESRLARLVSEHGHLPPEELRERVLREIESFVAGAPQHDDMTMILLKIDDFIPGAVAEGFGGTRA